MAKVKKLTKKENRSWEALDRCLDSPALYRTMKKKKGGFALSTDDITRANLKTLLTKINNLAVAKGRYDAMDILYECFFSSKAKFAKMAGDYAANLILYPAVGMSFITDARFKKDIGIEKRTMNGLSVLQKLEPLIGCDHLNKELADIQERLPALLDKYFEAKLGLTSLPAAEVECITRWNESIKLASREVRESAESWTDKIRFVEAAKLLQEIKYPKRYATLAAITKIIPSIETLNRTAIKVRIERYIKKLANTQ